VRVGFGLLVLEKVGCVLVVGQVGVRPTTPARSVLWIAGADNALVHEVVYVAPIRPIAECDPLLVRPEAASLGVSGPELVLVDDGLGDLEPCRSGGRTPSGLADWFPHEVGRLK
jgi:hypothetical protein